MAISFKKKKDKTVLPLEVEYKKIKKYKI
jgi:hypothetical protein